MPAELRAIRAQFHSRCAICDAAIQEDDPVVMLPDDEEWVHATCAEDEGYDVREPEDD